MHADSSVELGRDDPALELPWSSPDGARRYYDLKRRPELLLEVQEAHDNRELAEFLVSTNSAISMFETAKCDTWLSNELSEAEMVYGAAWKFGSYVDLVFTERESRFALSEHEAFAERLVKLLARAPEISAAAEFIIRRCYYRVAGDGDSETGYCITFYLYGYGDDEDEARRRWNVGLKLVENALVQLSAQSRKEAAR
ncbi:MAG TPA: hypothetical protein VLA96_12975 [Terriglobales bacterium]|jgi:hypothetical protein|nr:hypothetical protein [Terriglobales bacterium]